MCPAVGNVEGLISVPSGLLTRRNDGRDHGRRGLQKEAAQRGGDAKAPETLLKDWASHSPQLRSAILEALLAREPWAYELLKQAEAGKVPLGQFDPARRQRLLKHSSVRVKERAQKLFGSGGATGFWKAHHFRSGSVIAFSL